MQIPSSNPPHITDEMLSAYIDNALPEDEHNFVEAAIAIDADVAWRLKSLRQTVTYLNELPALTLPRSFALPANIALSEAPTLSEPSTLTERRSAREMATPPRVIRNKSGSQNSGFWAGLSDFLQGGNAISRNAMAASMALVLLLIGGGLFYGEPLRRNFMTLTNQSAPQTGSTVSTNETAIVESVENAPAAAAAATANGNSAATGAIITSEAAQIASTPVSVAMLPTKTAPAEVVSQTADLPLAEPTNAEFVDPAVTPSRPLAQPTPTQLPAPEQPLAQAQSADTAVQDYTAAVNESADSVDAGTFALEEVAEAESLGVAASSRRVPLPNAADASASDVAVAGVVEETGATSIEAASVVPLPIAAPTEDSPSQKTSLLSPLPIVESTSLAAELAALPALIIEVDENSGALTGTLQMRQNSGTLHPLALADIGLVQLDAEPSGDEGDNTDSLRTDSLRTVTDNNGLFIFVAVAPGKYGLWVDIDGSQLRLTMPDMMSDTMTNNETANRTDELIIEIKAGEQKDIGTLEYESLP